MVGLYRGMKDDYSGWAEGFYTAIHDMHAIDYKDSNDVWVWASIKPETVTAAVGVSDKNDKPIFVQDILQSECGNIGVVTSGAYIQDGVSHLGYYIKWVTNNLRPDLLYWNNKSIVIGNTFENSELIKKCTNCSFFIKSERNDTDYECLKTKLLFMPQKINPNDCSCIHWEQKGRASNGRTVCKEHECSE